MNQPLAHPLSDEEFEQLEDFLFSPAVSEEALDYIGIHGLLTAVAICPKPISRETWLEAIFTEEPGWESEEQKSLIISLLERELTTLKAELEGEEPLELPCDLTLDDEEGLLTSWAQAFMEGVYLDEAAWFDEHESEVAELMLPIMLASDLFEDPDLRAIRKNAKMTQQFCDEIPDLLTDLYLLFRAPAENKGGKNGRPGPRVN
ncbi:YecA/YgfB family protein [Balneatrix alpica]|uniref:YecA family protein n=1 Tax=Balneatrix alpica TaxID=75684 RepID=A0ABV5Z6W3_9GAMM|nr:YecA family protein [Balneatrix alpica]